MGLFDLVKAFEERGNRIKQLEAEVEGLKNSDRENALLDANTRCLYLSEKTEEFSVVVELQKQVIETLFSGLGELGEMASNGTDVTVLKLKIQQVIEKGMRHVPGGEDFERKENTDD